MRPLVVKFFNYFEVENDDLEDELKLEVPRPLDIALEAEGRLDEENLDPVSVCNVVNLL